MKKILLVAAIALLFSACKQPEPPASVTSPPAAESQPQPDTGDRLPEGIELSVPYTVISDDWSEEDGARLRKTMIEFEQADAKAVGQQVSESMVAAGYRLTGVSEARGGERFNFRGDPRLRVGVLVRPRGSVRLENSRSTGHIEFSYTQLPEAEPENGQGSN